MYNVDPTVSIPSPTTSLLVDTSPTFSAAQSSGHQHQPSIHEALLRSKAGAVAAAGSATGGRGPKPPPLPPLSEPQEGGGGPPSARSRGESKRQSVISDDKYITTHVIPNDKEQQYLLQQKQQQQQSLHHPHLPLQMKKTSLKIADRKTPITFQIVTETSNLLGWKN